MSGKVSSEASYDGLRCSVTEFVQLQVVAPIVYCNQEVTQWRSWVRVWGFFAGSGAGKIFKKRVVFFFLNCSDFLTVKSLYFALDAIAETSLMFQYFFFFCAKIAKKCPCLDKRDMKQYGRALF